MSAHRFPPGTPETQRFWGCVTKGDNCWEWIGHRKPHGYGTFMRSAPARIVAAHRFSWELSNGPIPKGMNVLHRCDNPPCVRPEHLFLGNQKTNVADAVAKGRLRFPLGRGETHYAARLTDEDVLAIRKACAAGESRDVLADRYGVTARTIRAVVNHEKWRHL